MKRLLALALIFTFVLAPVASFAMEDGLPVHDGTIIPKSLELLNEGTSNPGLKFKFEFSEPTVEDGDLGAELPAIEPVEVEFAAGSQTVVDGSNKIVIDEAAFLALGLGVYKYTVKEVDPNIAGANIDDKYADFYVYVQNNDEGTPVVTTYLIIWDGEEKSEEFENSFEAGDLVITKTVTGNLGDPEKEFEVTVTLNAPTDKTVLTDVITVGGEEYEVTFVEGVATVVIAVKDGSEITIANLPYGVTYSVDEDADDYKATIDDQGTGTIEAASQTVAITNDKSEDPPMGITLDNLPYIIMLAGAAIGMVFFLARRRAEEN